MFVVSSFSFVGSSSNNPPAFASKFKPLSASRPQHPLSSSTTISWPCRLRALHPSSTIVPVMSILPTVSLSAMIARLRQCLDHHLLPSKCKLDDYGLKSDSNSDSDSGDASRQLVSMLMPYPFSSSSTAAPFPPLADVASRVFPPSSSSSFPDDSPPPLISGNRPNLRFKPMSNPCSPACAALELSSWCSIGGGGMVEMMAMILAKPTSRY